MKLKEILKRSYYALTSGGLMIAMLVAFGIALHDGYFHVIHPIRYGTIIIAVSLTFCWIMTRHNRREGVILLSVMGVTALLSAIHTMDPFTLGYHVEDYGHIFSAWSVVMALPATACMMVAGFVSDTKYHNIFPNQRKWVSTLFRVVSWTGQILISALLVAILLTAVGVLK